MTQKESKPEDSAAVAVFAIRSNSRSLGTPSKVKLGSWNPRYVTMLLPTR
ncbi:MAG: hypothetical protein ACXVPX_11180 [Actinomycetota bacterium]